MHFWWNWIILELTWDKMEKLIFLLSRMIIWEENYKIIWRSSTPWSSRNSILRAQSLKSRNRRLLNTREDFRKSRNLRESRSQLSLKSQRLNNSRGLIRRRVSGSSKPTTKEFSVLSLSYSKTEFASSMITLTNKLSRRNGPRNSRLRFRNSEDSSTDSNNKTSRLQPVLYSRNISFLAVRSSPSILRSPMKTLKIIWKSQPTKEDPVSLLSSVITSSAEWSREMLSTKILLNPSQSLKIILSMRKTLSTSIVKNTEKKFWVKENLRN